VCSSDLIIDGNKEAEMIAVKGKYLNDILINQIKLLRIEPK
jgi:hypothetical protein